MTAHHDARRLVVLGSTGSIGVQALDVVNESLSSDGPLQLVGLSAGSSWRELLAQAAATGVTHVQLDDPIASREAQAVVDSSGGGVSVLESVGVLLDETQPDIVLNAVVGFAGLQATVAALERGCDVALANKESLVAAGALCMDLARRTGARILPVDSEHSALLQCMGGSTPAEIASLVLTASGGPFRGRSRAELEQVTVEQALAHPTWRMGGKISIDSATLMNKGLELIEAQVLFDVTVDEVEVVVHPHSIVHALVRHRDGALLAHLGWPDMRVPIAYALHYPSRPAVAAVRRLELTDMPALSFEPPDVATFRCLALAQEAGRAGGGAPCVLNAANEIAVEAFLEGRAGFLDIDRVVAATLEQVDIPGVVEDFAAVRELDRRARAQAQLALDELQRMAAHR